jgi:hypothetical protein
MPVAAAIPSIVKVGGAVLGAVGSRKAAKSANQRGDKLSAEATESGKNLQETADTMNERSADRWDFYKEHGQNVDVMLIDDAVKMFKETFAGGSERAAARAAEDVASAFDRSAEVRRRAALRFGGVDPTSGKFQGLERTTEIERAKAEAGARFGARRSEEDRARAILNNASQIGRDAVTQSNSLARTGIFADKAAADIFNTQRVDARDDAAGSAALVGDIAGKIPFEKMFQNGSEPAVSETVSNDRPYARGADGSGVENDEPIFKDGGVIPGDGRRGGMIKGHGTGTSDSVRAVVDGTNQRVRLSAGEFIIPEKVVKQKGERFFQQMIRG